MMQIDGLDFARNERLRQVREEGYDAAHDAGHADKLLDAAVSYAAAAEVVISTEKITGVRDEEGMQATFDSANPPPRWPWSPDEWKPAADAVRNLTIAVALAAAAIDSLIAADDRVRDDYGRLR
jgi:hypothetical protein